MEIFNVVHTWAKNYVKYEGFDVETVQIFVSGSGRACKPHLVKVYNAISTILLDHCKGPYKSRVLLLEPTEISEINIGGTFIHHGLAVTWFK